MVGITETAYGWKNGFLLLLSVDITATLVPLSKICFEDILEIVRIRKGVEEVEEEGEEKRKLSE